FRAGPGIRRDGALAQGARGATEGKTGGAPSSRAARSGGADLGADRSRSAQSAVVYRSQRRAARGSGGAIGVQERRGGEGSARHPRGHGSRSRPADGNHRGVPADGKASEALAGLGGCERGPGQCARVLQGGAGASQGPSYPAPGPLHATCTGGRGPTATGLPQSSPDQSRGDGGWRSLDCGITGGGWKRRSCFLGLGARDDGGGPRANLRALLLHQGGGKWARAVAFSADPPGARRIHSLRERSRGRDDLCDKAPSGMSFSYFRDLLPSGMRVVTVEAPHLHTALISAYVRTGSRHEEGSNNGVSHFLEHMFFRGSAAFPDTVHMNAAIEEVGGNLNGVTTRDHSYYFTPIHPDHLDVGVQILGDMLTRPLLRQMEVQRKIILDEMLDE